MPNSLSATGLTVATTDENSTDLATALKAPAVYGPDINVGPESPDGQAIGIFAQAESDVLDLQVDIYNSFSPATAYGVTLQSRVALNGMTIKGGTYTTTPVNITALGAGTLPGLDQTAVAPYQVRDPNNIWTLVSSYAFVGAGTQALIFKAATLGPISPLPNTINAQATPLTFVNSVNNPTIAGAVIGQPYETDPALRTRQARSFSLAAGGVADAVEGQLLNLSDVTDAVVSENKGVAIGPFPVNSLWCVVVGGTPAEIAQVIYTKGGAGPGLFGAQTYTVIRPNGQGAVINWDTGLPLQLYARFSILPAVPGITFDNTLLIQQLAAALIAPYFRLGRAANIGDIVRAMFKINPQVVVVSPGVSLVSGSGYSSQVAPTSAKYYFQIPAANISIV